MIGTKRVEVPKASLAARLKIWMTPEVVIGQPKR
jgi:hypothetical protein